MKALPIGSKVCQCSACGEYFTAVTAFDQHRSGPYTARVCLNPASLGLVKNDKGRWGKPGAGKHWSAPSGEGKA